MNFDPFNMPSFGSDPGGRLQGDINTLAPLATSYHGALPSPDIQQYIPTARTDTGNLAKFAHFIGGVGTELGHITTGATKWLVTNAKNMVEAPVKYGAGLGHGLLDRSTINSIAAQNQAFSSKLDTLNRLYKSGRINSTQFKTGIAELNQDMTNLTREATGLNNRIALDQKDTVKAAIDTAATLTTVLTAGFGRAASVALTKNGALPIGEKLAADYLASPAADTLLQESEAALRKVALNGQAFGRLSPAVQDALQVATADVVASAAPTMTSSQIARASVINLAFKYPVYFNYASSTGQQIYQELDQAKYGDAVRTTAFNAALLLSGGPIGQALKYGGKALGGVSARTFGKTAFWDEMSKYYGDGTEDGFKRAAFSIASGMSKEDGEAFIKDLSATEATNMAAVNHDAVAAASRVAEGMKNQRGFGDLTTFTHEEGLQDMANMSHAQRLADEAGKKAGLGPITVGVTDARSLKGIADKLSGVGWMSRGKAWETMKKTMSSYPWANNKNFDIQMKNILKDNKSGEALTKAIGDIKAGFSVKGFPKEVSKELSRMGYLPIKPVNFEAPFQEGVGKLTTKFSDNEDFFIHATQPWPVLGHVGSLITHMGLSPNASTERTYQLFNQNVARNLNDTKAATSIAAKLGEGEAQIPDDMSDFILKKLKNVDTRLPVRDYRMYTNKDIRTALDVTHAEAAEVQDAIAKSYFQVPLAVRGLGDKAVDTIYRTSVPRALTSRYMKIQGALRFSFNPFFQYLRVIPKTEILSEAEGGGFISSIFSGQGRRMNSIRQALHEQGAFEKSGHFSQTFGAEAAETITPVDRNLGKKLLPMQERSISGLIGAQADRMGLDWQTYMKNFPDQVRDTVQMIAEYDRKSNFLNSPLARTLNIAFFPFRFETKVATIFARNLAKSSLLTQVAVVNGVMQAHDWLNTTEGKVWYSQNSEAIGIFKYITPLASLSEVFESLLPGHDHHLGNFGELGGLPFGWIPQLLDAEGLTQFNAPGVNPKTGEVFPDYIPQTTKGQAAIAVQDLIGSLFSYPGATLGLPSKNSIARNAAQGLTTAKKVDFKLSTPVNLSAQQQDYATTIHNLAATAPGALQPPTPTSPNLPATTVPPQDSTVLHPLPKPGGSGAKKKKKADFIPALLPGQSYLGQL